MNLTINLFAFCTVLLATSPLHAIPYKGQKILIVGPSKIATEAGERVARENGNVVDVAVATGFALAVTSPYYASLGGGGFAVIKTTKLKTPQALDFRETAPSATHKDFYLKLANDASRIGGAAIGVPGVAAGLYELHKKYGKLSWKKVVQPAIELAKTGFIVSGEWSENTERSLTKFVKPGKKHFVNTAEEVVKPGSLFKQPALAKALDLIKNKGAEGFYSGIVAKDIVQSISSQGGVMTLSDLKNYKTRWLEPMIFEIKEHKLYLMPPPSSGGTIIGFALNFLEKLSAKPSAPLSADEFHAIAEALRIGFSFRNELADPAFQKNTVVKTFNPSEVDKWIKLFDYKKIIDQKVLEKNNVVVQSNQSLESAETTHYSVMNSEGEAVAITVTLNGNYGSGVVTEKYGIALNNEMDDFNTRPGQPNMFGLIQGEANGVEAGKRPLSSMSPSLVEKDGKIVMAIGSPGGPRIISAVTQVLYRLLFQNYDMDTAIQTPRVHHQFNPQKVFLDPLRFGVETKTAMTAKGHVLQESPIARVFGIRLN